MENKSVQLARACLSQRTGFIHLFAGQPGGDAIPIYENFCFAIALIRQKTVQGVQDGKDLLLRLYPFQVAEGAWYGNFPLYLHEYPRCFSPIQPLCIAALIQQLLRDFSHVLNEDFKNQTKRVLEKLIECARRRREEKAFDSIWERRYLALIRQSTPMNEGQSSSDWAEELITSQLLEENTLKISQLIHPALRIYCGPSEREEQDCGEPRFNRLEAWAGRSSPPHPEHLKSVAVSKPNPPHDLWSGEIGGWQVRQGDGFALSFAMQPAKGLALRYIWAGRTIHSLAVPTFDAKLAIEEDERGVVVHFDLPERSEVEENDLFEAALFCDLSEETLIRIDNKIATQFFFGQEVQIQTPDRSVRLLFDLEEGAGDFVGQISRSNRPFQIQKEVAYDWKIALRTLRRSVRARLRLRLCFDAAPSCRQPFPSHAIHCRQTVPLQ